MASSLSSVFASPGAPRHECRRWVRFPIKTAVELVWQTPEGQQKSAHGKASEMSDTGMSIKVSGPLPCPSIVHVTVDKLRLSGTAHVRHCHRSGFGYVIGLEFRGRLLPMNWSMH